MKLLLKQGLLMLLCFCTLLSLIACKTPEEQEKIDEENMERAQEIAEEYFDETFVYDFDFYNGGGEFDVNQYMYVYTDGETINCVAIPAKENGAGPYAYYDCTLHQYSSGRWSLESYEDWKSVEE